MQTPSSYPKFKKDLNYFIEKARKLNNVSRNKVLMNLYFIAFTTEERMSKDHEEQLKIANKYIELVGNPYHIHDKTLIIYNSKINILKQMMKSIELIKTCEEFVSYLEGYEVAPEDLHFTLISLCFAFHFTQCYDKKNEILEKLSSSSLIKFGENSKTVLKTKSFLAFAYLNDKKFLIAEKILVPLLEIVRTIDNSEENINSFVILSFIAYVKANIEDNEEFKEFYKKVEAIALKYPFNNKIKGFFSLIKSAISGITDKIFKKSLKKKKQLKLKEQGERAFDKALMIGSSYLF